MRKIAIAFQLSLCLCALSSSSLWGQSAGFDKLSQQTTSSANNRSIMSGIMGGQAASSTAAPVAQARKISETALAGYGVQLTKSTSSHTRFGTAWSPDGSTITYAEDGDIFIIPSQGGNPVNLTDRVPGVCMAPCFTPDGKSVTFTWYDGVDGTTYEIDNIAISTRNVTLVIDKAALGVWSHDGRWLAFRSLIGQLCVVDTGTGILKVINAGDAASGLLAFTSDDKIIITTMIALDGSKKLFGILRDGGNPAQLTLPPGDHYFPQCSPDGNWVIYSVWSAIDSKYRLNAFSTATLEVKPIFGLEVTASCMYGAFSPDNRKISYLADIAGNGTYEVFATDSPFALPTVVTLADTPWPMRGQNLQHTGRGIATVAASSTVKWKFQPDNSVNSSPAIGSDGTIYVGSDDNYLYAVKSDGTLKWKFPTGFIVRLSPAIGSDGTVYVGSFDNYFYAVKSDGTLKWKFQTGSSVGSSPAIGTDGTVYVGSYDKYLYAVKSDGTLKWKFQTGSYVSSSPAIGTDGTVYVGSYDTYLYAVKSDGTLKWKFQTGDVIDLSSPAISSDGTVYVGSNDFSFYAVKSDGTLKWKFQTGSYVTTSPAIGSDGAVYVGAHDGYLYAFAPETPGGTITVTTPNGGEKIVAGTDFKITWTATGVTAFTVEFSADGGTVWTPVPAAAIDNTAKVCTWRVPTLASDKYLVRVSDSSNKAVSDVSNAVFSIIPATVAGVRVTAPNGGESWTAGATQTVTWTSSGVTNVKIEYTTDSGTTWTAITASMLASSGSLAWAIPATLNSPGCKVRITDTTNSAVTDVSDGVFTILPVPKIVVTSPNGGEKWPVGSTQMIKWDGVATAKVEFTIDSGTTWTTLPASATTLANAYSWTIPDMKSDRCLVRVTNLAGTVSDVSDGVFSIVAAAPTASIRVTAPNGGESWTAGTTQNVTWTATGVTNVKIEYTTNNGSTLSQIAASTPASAGTYAWTIHVATPASAQCFVRVSDASNAAVNDVSNAVFSIVAAAPAASIKVTAPNGGERWTQGSTLAITWDHSGVSTVKIEFSTDGGSTWMLEYTGSFAYLRTYSWKVPNVIS
ncbi:MAG: PQQ-binding-like beta-propeller repeat protein, partial [Candidatus Latescibacter sp.]|nr:PQQ-binding-like beta-propeller repeat protein [Candidatus Latescibacter sp.]